MRALDILKKADWIGAEDTRNSQRLLNAYNIKTRLRPCHDHNETGVALQIVADIKAGQAVALISDAGTPLLSDPGYRLVQECIRHDIPIVPVPGANAILPALQLSGLPSHEFYFGGFLPAKSAARVRQLQNLKQIGATLIFYEAPHRLLETLQDCHAVFGDRAAAVTRELTKKFEEAARAPLSLLVEKYRTAPRGEIVLLIEGIGADEKWNDDRVADALRFSFGAGGTFRDSVALVTEQSGWPKRDVYNLATRLKNDETEQS